MVLWKALTTAGTVPGHRQGPRPKQGSTAVHRQQSCRHIPGSSQPWHLNESTCWPPAEPAEMIYVHGLQGFLRRKGRDPRPGYLAPRQLASVQGAQKQLPWPGGTADIYHGKCKPPFASSSVPLSINPKQRPSGPTPRGRCWDSAPAPGDTRQAKEALHGAGGAVVTAPRAHFPVSQQCQGYRQGQYLAHGVALPPLGGFLPRRPGLGLPPGPGKVLASPPCQQESS